MGLARISIRSLQKHEDHQVHRLPHHARDQQGRESAPPRTVSTLIDCGSRGQTDRTKPNRVDQETRRNADKRLDGTGRTAQTVRRARRPSQSHECGRARPVGALMARQTGSGRMSVHEILIGGSQTKCSSDASSSTTTQRRIQRTQTRRATRSGAAGIWTRHCEDSQAGDQKDPGAPGSDTTDPKGGRDECKMAHT